MQQTHILILWAALLNLNLLLSFLFIFVFIILRFLLLALFDRCDQLFCLFVLLQLLLLYNFGNIERWIFKRRFALVGLNDLQKGLIDWELFNAVISKFWGSLIFWADNFEGVLSIGKNQCFDTSVTKSMSAHGENARCLLFCVLKVAKRT